MKKIIKKNLFVIFITICITISILILNNKKQNIIVKNTTNCNNTAKLYYAVANQKIYSYCLDSIKLTINDQTIELKDYLKYNDINDLIKHLERKSMFYDGGTILYKDGGTKKISTNCITIIKCNTLEGNKDIYIGNKNMEYKSNFCKNNNKTFTRSYKIIKVEESEEEYYNDCLTCIHSKSFKVTLNQFQGETKTITINNLDKNLIENNTYEFEFMLYDDIINIEDNIESIFKNSIIVEIRKSNKIGSLQRQDRIN